MKDFEIVNRTDPMIDFSPESAEDLKARYPLALTPTYEQGMRYDTICVDRPGQLRRHVFDFRTGLRLIISHELTPDLIAGIHISASMTDKALMEFSHLSLIRYLEHIIFSWQAISGSTRQPAFLGLTSGKGIPHLWVPDREEL